MNVISGIRSLVGHNNNEDIIIAMLSLDSNSKVDKIVDKIIDWQGNYTWLKGHFSKTFLKSYVKPMLFIILLLEVFSGVLCLSGSLFGLLNNDTSLILNGLIIVGINLIALFFGQRYAKDYQGAAILVNYFILTIIGIFSFNFV